MRHNNYTFLSLVARAPSPCVTFYLPRPRPERPAGFQWPGSAFQGLSLWRRRDLDEGRCKNKVFARGREATFRSVRLIWRDCATEVWAFVMLHDTGHGSSFSRFYNEFRLDDPEGPFC